MEVTNIIQDMEVQNIMKKIEENDVPYLRKFFRKYPHKITQTDITGRTYLMIACVEGNTDVISYLIETGAELNLRDEHGRTALHHAVDKKHYDVVSLMVSKDSVELDVKDKMEMTPLLLAIPTGNLGIIHGLIAHGANINAVNNDGNNCVHIAVNSKVECWDSELECWDSEVEPMSILNKYCTQLELGEDCRYTQPIVVSYLAHHGADLYCKNKNNKTALDLIKDKDLRAKIKSLFPQLRCMFCGIIKPLVKFDLCGYSLSCEECYSKNPLRKCLSGQQLVRKKSGFEPQVLEGKYLKMVSERVAGDWQTLGRELGVTEYKLTNIKCNNQKVEDQSYQMMCEWFIYCDANQRTIKTLRKALEKTVCVNALECLPQIK